MKADVNPNNWAEVNESPHQARVGRGIHHEIYQAHGAADHPQTQNRGVAARPRQDRRRGLRWMPFIRQFRPMTSLTPGERNRVQSQSSPHGEF